MAKNNTWILSFISSIWLNKLALGELDIRPYGCPEKENCGEPLFLTPLLKNSNAFEAQRAAMVHFPNTTEFQMMQSVKSYSGFFTVNETLSSNIFFWFLLAENEPKDTPIILWLEGGPGSASTPDVFLSSGPQQLTDDSLLSPGSNRWTQVANVLFLDSPVGTGFSFTKNKSGYATSQEDYTRDLYSALSQFFLLFPDLRANKFFIAGASYAGKYVPALAYKIHEKNIISAAKINLKGIAVGNGWIDPATQLEYSKFLYGIGLIDLETKSRFEIIEKEILILLKNKEYSAASEKLNFYVFATGHKSYKRENTIKGLTGISHINYLVSDAEQQRMFAKLDKGQSRIFGCPEFRRAIHAGNVEFWSENIKYQDDYLLADFVKSVASKLEVLMDNYRVILYAGQLDIICNYLLMIDTVRKLKWGGAEEYKNATRHQWWVEGELAGYTKTVGNFTEILVRDAGHGVFWEQPLWHLELLRQFTHNIPFNEY